jgi:hypothetical protein
MHSKWMGRIGLAALVTGIVGTSSGMMGCAAERDPINRVQANAIPKSFFIGGNFQDTADDPEFYARSMVVDVPYGESGSDFLMFTNTINSLAKIKWSIEENALIGRVSFERIEGTDGKGLPPKKDPERDPSKPLAQNDGVVIYNFAITSQFDIRRQYNAQTGEESNVVEENSSDRPWYDREYIRVDFSQNRVTAAYDFDTLSLLGVYNGIEYQPIAFDVRNPNDENAPVYDIENGYLDVTNKLFAKPKNLHLWGQEFPGCLLPNIIRGGTEPAGNCNPNEISVRHSFKRVVNTDYEPIDWDGARFETYGSFFMERNGYARDYGLADAKWKRHISRYNIWERHHYYKDPERMEGAVSCRSDNECGAVPGIVTGSSHCDKYNQKCTLPFEQRKEKPIVWHYADRSAPEYFDANTEATDEWDTAMRVAVQSAKYAECQRFQPDSGCADKYPGIVDGNFADEEDAVFLVKEVNACRRNVRLAQTCDPTKGTPEEKLACETAKKVGTDLKTCDGLADSASDARKYAPSVRAVAKMKEMVVLCHSPVTAADALLANEKGEKLCGEEGTVARLGDLRFHLVTAVAKPETNSPWGIMSDSNDPTTGEHVAGSINVWTHVNDLFSRGIVDTLRYIGGELKIEDITDGKYVNNWVEAARNTNGIGLTPRMTTEEVDKRVASVMGTTVEKLHAVEAKFGTQNKSLAQRPPIQQALLNNLKRIEKTRAAWDAPSVNAPIYEARMNQLRGTPIEAALITPAMQDLARAGIGDIASGGGLTNTGNPTTGVFRGASVLDGLNPQFRKSLEQRLEVGLANRNACIMHYEALAPLGYVVLGDMLQDKFGKFNPNDDPAIQAKRADAMKDYLRRKAHYSVVSHEMGHSFALRHNFVSSSDAWNFRWQYWALRTNGKTVSTECSDKKDNGDGSACVGPRWLDKVTPNELKNNIHMWSQSSTMEYAGEPTQDLLGLGAYDFGAARMFYGDNVTVYKDARFNYKQAAGSVAMEHQNEFGGLLGFRYGSFSSPIHYSHLDNEVSLIEKCDTGVNAQAFQPSNWNTEKDGKWNPVLDGHLVTNDANKFMRCTQPKVDYVQWDAMKNESDKTHAHDAKGRTRVPHGFASDEWADLGNVAVFRHDNGADLYETMHFWIAQQEMNHIFNSYRRGRRDFNIWGAFNRTLGRYHEKMRDSAKALGLYVNLAKDTVVQYNSSGDDPMAFAADILKQVALTGAVSSSIAFDHFAHVFARPQPGGHGQLGDEAGPSGLTIARSYDGTGFANTGTTAPLLNVANGVTGQFGTISLGGRPIENALARDKGRDYDRNYTLNVGSYYEKAFTAYLFSESADNFISSSRDDYVDPRFRAVSLADIFPDGFRRWLANNLTDDEVVKGVYALGQGNGGGPAPPALDEKGYALLGSTSWWPTTGAEVCFPKADQINCRQDPFAPGSPSPAAGTVIDPQIGFEQQKFAMLLSLIFIRENQKTYWTDQMRLYDGNVDNPDFDDRVEFHDPSGRTWIARSFGTEVLFGKTVEKGIGARMLQYANELLATACITEPVTRGSGAGARTVGLRCKLGANGKPTFVNNGTAVESCDNSKGCQRMKNYVAIPTLMRQAMGWLGYIPGIGDLKGVY